MITNQDKILNTSEKGYYDPECRLSSCHLDCETSIYVCLSLHKKYTKRY